MLKPLIALTAGEYKDSVPWLYSLSCSPYKTKQKPQIGSSHSTSITTLSESFQEAYVMLALPLQGELSSHK